MSKINAIINRLSGHLPGWLLVALMLMVLVESVSRYALRSPLMIADEMGGYIVVAITFLSLAYTWKEKGHIRVEFVISKLPSKVRKRLRFATQLIALGLTVILAKASYVLVMYSHDFGVRSHTWLRTSLQWPQIVLFAGSLLLIIQLCAEIVKTFKEKEL